MLKPVQQDKLTSCHPDENQELSSKKIKMQTKYHLSDSKKKYSMLLVKKAIRISVPFILCTVFVRKATCNISTSFTSDEKSTINYNEGNPTCDSSNRSISSSKNTSVLFQSKFESESKMMGCFRDSIRSYSLPTLITLLTIFSLLFTSCTKLIEVDAPITSTNADLVYATDAAAVGVLTSIYSNMSSSVIINGGITSMPLFTGLYADEFHLFSGVSNTAHIAYSTNSLTGSITGNTDFWNNIYPIIFTANSALEGVTLSTTLSDAVKQQLLGEAKFIRAFCYFYLVNLYGDVPLVTTTNYKINSLLARTPTADVYQQIFIDLKEAEQQLSDHFIDGTLKTTSERTSPNKWSARALLARSYLYSKDYVNAETYASLLINNKALFDTVPINSVFLINSKETIWQLQAVGSSVTNTWEGRIFGLSAAGPNKSLNPVFLSPDFPSNFESGDLRGSQWIKNVTVGTNTYNYPYKYKVTTPGTAVSEYSMVFRLSEQYLIRAEARINQGSKIADGIGDLNVLRTRARATATADIPNPLPTLSPNLSKEDALAAVEHERQVELFTEWGHRWFDLRRMAGGIDPSKTRADEVLSVKKGSNWQSTDLLFPIPQTEIDKNPSLRGHQNPGYN